MGQFTDIHCHILPAVDDGPQTIDESLVLAKALFAAGFQTVIATPHFDEDFSTVYREHITAQHFVLVERLREEGLPLCVHVGAEIMLTPKVMEIAKNKELPTLHSTPYVLLELPFYQPVPHYTKEAMFVLQSLGYQPIIAHPERCKALQKYPEQLEELACSGVLFQINAASVTGLYGKSAKLLAGKILAAGQAHFLATDSHNVLGPRQFLTLLNRYNLPMNALASKNPNCLLANQPPQPVLPLQNQSFFSRLYRRILK